MNAVIHSHAPHAVAASLVGIDLSKIYIPEIMFITGKIYTTKYSTPTTQEVPPTIKDLVKKTYAIILDRHGTLTYGDTIEKALYRLESLDNLAKILLLASSHSKITPINEDQEKRLKHRIINELGIDIKF